MSDIGTRDNQRVSKGASQNDTRRGYGVSSRLSTVKGTTISFTSTATIADTGNRFAAFGAGDMIRVTGSPLNSRVWEVTAAALTAGAVAATGYIQFSAVPAANSTITLNGTAVTFKASGATGEEVNIVSGSLSGTLSALLVVLEASEDAELLKFTYDVDLSASRLNLTAATAGTAGNDLTIAASVAEPSDATLLGGVAAVASDTLTVRPALVQSEVAGAAITVERVA